MQTRKLICFFWSVLYCSIFSCYAQCDYRQKQFGYKVDSNVFFGVDTIFSGHRDSLFLDIYKPIGDFNDKRPELMLIHGGGFNSGNRNEMRQICIEYARRGFVAATIDYRLGFYRPLLPNNYPYLYDGGEFYRAVYRARQDAAGALRFLKGRAGIDSIDLTNVFIGGASAGGITALELGYAHSDTLRRRWTYRIGNVVLGFDQFKRPDLGDFYGKLNLNGHDTKIKGVINVFGAIVDTTWILNNQSPSLFSYHQVNDPVVACGRNAPYWGIPLNPSQYYPALHGSCYMNKLFKRLNFDPAQNEFHIYNGNAHAIHNYYAFDTLLASYLQRQICPPPMSVPNLKEDEFRIWSVPRSQQITFENRTEEPRNLNIELFDSSGRLLKSVRQFNVGAKGFNLLDVSDNKSGMYLVRIKYHNKYMSKKIVL